jgi:hypothetical protein
LCRRNPVDFIQSRQWTLQDLALILSTIISIPLYCAGQFTRLQKLPVSIQGGDTGIECDNPRQLNIPITDLSGLYFGNNGRLFILTIDGKF